MEYKIIGTLIKKHLTFVKLARYIRKLSNKCSLNTSCIFPVNVR